MMRNFISCQIFCLFTDAMPTSSRKEVAMIIEEYLFFPRKTEPLQSPEKERYYAWLNIHRNQLKIYQICLFAQQVK